MKKLTHKVYDSGLKKEVAPKIRFDLIPVELIERIAKQFTHGAEKYGEGNWKKGKGIETHIFMEAAYRHFIKWVGGVEDGEDHGIACVTNIIMSEWHSKHKIKN
jgi:hypothetical protein